MKFLLTLILATSAFAAQLRGAQDQRVLQLSDCTACAGSSSGQCLQDNGVCWNAVGGVCPYYAPTPCGGSEPETPDSIPCTLCVGGTSGPCQHPTNNVCYDRLPSTGDCPTLTNECTAAPSETPSAPPSASPSSEPSSSPSAEPSVQPSGSPSNEPVASSITIDFDDILLNQYVGSGRIPDGYMGFNWENFYVVHKDYHSGSGYDHGTTSGEYTALNGGGVAASFSAPADTDIFSLHSLQATSAWNDDNVLDINGYKGANIVATMSVILQTSGPTLVVFGSDFTDLTKVKVVTSKLHVAIDDMLIFF
jgi:hypothetical protein